jgi:hypothetical protein
MNQPTIAVVVIGDGRDEYLRSCIESMDHLRGNIVERWMYDDTGDAGYRSILAARYPHWRHINGGSRQGCAGAFQQVWRQVRAGTKASHVFLVEQDFVFFRTIDLDAMVAVLDDNPQMASMALRRQPWNEQEKAAGGIVEMHPDWYTDHVDEQGRAWLEYNAFFTTNCPVFRVSLMDVPWPSHQPGRYSEGTFHQLLQQNRWPGAPDRPVTYGYWGSRDSGTWVEHIGAHRIGMGY